MALNRHHPSRAVLVVARPGGTSELATWASVQCHRLSGDAPVLCTEQVTIEATTGALDRVTSLILALVVPDVPVVVWWLGDPAPRRPPFDTLFPLADLFVLDAETFSTPFISLRDEAHLCITESRQTTVTDLTWHRLSGWRSQLAHLFDAPEWAARLSDIVRVELRSAPLDAAVVFPAEAFFAAGWLAGSLGWRPHAARHRPAEGEYLLEFRTPAGRRDILLRPSRQEGRHTPGRLIALEMHTGERPPLRLALSRAGRSQCLDVTVCQGERVRFHHVAAWHSLPLPACLAKVIMHASPDDALGTALHTLAPLAEELTGGTVTA
ncbi:MAG: glucose-6-phosphate dehydrogenase assembly protein OpcA [Ardenticatenia bacterium]|nr:glucose-6-phosphate dehydrogenase assembly protein OpcA [Ardenticatenia bacterium]